MPLRNHFIALFKYSISERRFIVSQTWNSANERSPERRTYTVEDIAKILGIGRTSAYMLVKEGHFNIVRIGSAIRISKRSFDEWLDSLDF